jgi:hypothetical protein
MQAVQKFAEDCAKSGVDVLINNAGIFGGHKSEDQGPLKGAVRQAVVPRGFAARHLQSYHPEASYTDQVEWC